MRGLFTAGVMDVLMEHGMTFDGLVGVSAGACFGCNYKSGQVGRVLRYNLRYAHALWIVVDVVVKSLKLALVHEVAVVVAGLPKRGLARGREGRKERGRGRRH